MMRHVRCKGKRDINTKRQEKEHFGDVGVYWKMILKWLERPRA
jgi:hypothetical protein